MADPARRARPARRALDGQGQHDRPLGAGRARPRAAVPDLPARVSRAPCSSASPSASAAAGSATSPRRAPRSSRGSGRSTSGPGKLIVYTSADSVFQIAAHERRCRSTSCTRRAAPARELLTGEHARGPRHRAAVRGRAGQTTRARANRRDFSLDAARADAARPAGRSRAPGAHRGQGGRPVRRARRHRGVAHERTTPRARTLLVRSGAASRGAGWCSRTWSTSISRTDIATIPAGFARALEQFDDRARRAARATCAATRCAGSPPTTATTRPRRAPTTRASTRRCWSPVRACGPGADLGTRETFADVGATLAEMFGVSRPQRARASCARCARERRRAERRHDAASPECRRRAPRRRRLRGRRRG